MTSSVAVAGKKGGRKKKGSGSKGRKGEFLTYDKEYSLESLREHFGNKNAPPDLVMPRTSMISISDLHVDHKYQRDLSRNHVIKMLEEFDSSGVGFLYVARRKDGTHWVVDGQQRLKLMQYLNTLFPERYQKVPCEVFDSNGEEHEAVLYRLRNHKKKMTALDIFKARYVYGDVDALNILRIVNKRGIKIKGIPVIADSGLNNIQVACVSALEEGYLLGKKSGMGDFVLENTIDAISKCWGLATFAFKNFLVTGFATLFSTYPDLDKGILVRSMNGQVPNGIKTKADVVSGFNRAKNVANYIAEEYNKRVRGSSRLDRIK